MVRLDVAVLDRDRRPVRRTGAVTLTFDERHEPRLIRAEDGTAARGRFEIDSGSGRIRASELTLPTKGTLANIKVAFAEHPRLGLWVPETMQERYVAGPLGEAMSGVARYSDYRQFRVDTTTEVGKGPTH